MIPGWASAADPVLAARVARDIRGHVGEGTRRDYDRVAASFIEFNAVRNLVPFPVNRFTLCMWIEYETMFISIESLTGTYLAAVKDAHEGRGFVWSLHGDALIHRTIRARMRALGAAPKLEKFALSLQMLDSLARMLPGWPNAATMSHDHRLWMAACTVAVPGMLRGGEFLTSARSTRPVLTGARVVTGSFGGKKCIDLDIESPKATWWVTNFPIRVFSPGVWSLLCPYLWLSEYRRMAPMLLPADGPAFVMANGLPASRGWWLDLTESLVSAAGITVLSSQGFPLHPRMSSARCGGVESAKLANVSDSDIMGMGRWSGKAWLRYASSTKPIALQKIAVNMYSFPAGRRELGIPVDLSVYDDMVDADNGVQVVNEEAALPGPVMPLSPLVVPAGPAVLECGELCIAHLEVHAPEDVCVFLYLGNGKLQWLSHPDSNAVSHPRLKRLSSLALFRRTVWLPGWEYNDFNRSTSVRYSLLPPQPSSEPFTADLVDVQEFIFLRGVALNSARQFPPAVVRQVGVFLMGAAGPVV